MCVYYWFEINISLPVGRFSLSSKLPPWLYLVHNFWQLPLPLLLCSDVLLLCLKPCITTYWQTQPLLSCMIGYWSQKRHQRSWTKQVLDGCVYKQVEPVTETFLPELSWWKASSRDSGDKILAVFSTCFSRAIDIMCTLQCLLGQRQKQHSSFNESICWLFTFVIGGWLQNAHSAIFYHSSELDHTWGPYCAHWG